MTTKPGRVPAEQESVRNRLLTHESEKPVPYLEPPVSWM